LFDCHRPARPGDPVNIDRAYWIARSSRAMTQVSIVGQFPSRAFKSHGISMASLSQISTMGRRADLIAAQFAKRIVDPRNRFRPCAGFGVISCCRCDVSD
jgi:hypothetical protein